MRASNLLYVKMEKAGENGEYTIAIGGISDAEIILNGCSAPTNAVLMGPHDTANSLQIAPRKEKRDLIALYVQTPSRGKHDRGDSFNFFLEINFSGEKPVVNLDTEAFLRPDRLAQHSNEGGIMFEIGEEAFLTRKSQYRKGMRLVPDPTLVCRYLLGEVGPEEIFRAAEKREEEEAARLELPRIREELMLTRKELDEAQKSIQSLRMGTLELANICDLVNPNDGSSLSDWDADNPGYNDSPTLQVVIRRLQSLTKERDELKQWHNRLPHVWIFRAILNPIIKKWVAFRK